MRSLAVHHPPGALVVGCGDQSSFSMEEAVGSLCLFPRPSAPAIETAARVRPTGRLLVAVAGALVLWLRFAGPAFAAGADVYRVQPGDTLSGIAQRVGVPVAQLEAINGLRNPNRILAGQLLHLRTSTSARPAEGFGPGPATRIIAAPYFSQFDGSIYAESNCGPTALATALGALGVRTDPITLRHLAARQMGFDNPAGGTTWESLAYAAHARGVATEGLTSGRHYRVWSIDDLKHELDQGHPVLLLVRYRSLPGHLRSSFWGDHYIVALGFDAAGQLVYDDPAMRNGAGANLRMSQGQLLQAWSSTAVRLVRTGLALRR